MTLDFAGLVGVSDATDAGRPICRMEPGEAAMGRPGAMHGGATATLLERAARAAVAAAAGDGPAIELASMTVDYLRVGPMAPSRAVGTLVKIGARVAVVTVTAWADDPAKPFAAAKLTYLLIR